MPHLVVRDKENTYNVKIEKGKELTIGRSPANELCFKDNATISNKHCLIYYSEEKDAYILRDLDSLNGTILNLNRISADIILSDNDKIKMGDIRLLFKESSYDPSTKTRKILKFARSKGPHGFDITATCVIPNLTAIKRKPVVKLVESLEFGKGDVIGSYEVVKKLAESSFGGIFLVQKPHSPKKLALKIFNKAFDIHHPAIDDFMNCTAQVMQVKNPYFLRIHDANLYQGHCFYVMDYVPHGDLNDIIAKSAPLKEEDSISIAYTIGDALREVYLQNKIIHGELSPDNILVDSQFNLLIKGYGLSRWIEKNLVEGQMVHNPWYSSPEQINNMPNGWYSDLYALGIIFFQLLSGHLPFHGDDYKTICNMHLTKDLPRPQKLNPNIAVTEETFGVLKRMTEKKPEGRFASWDDFVVTLEEVAVKLMEEETPEAEPVNPDRKQNVDQNLKSTFGSFFQ